MTEIRQRKGIDMTSNLLKLYSVKCEMEYIFVIICKFTSPYDPQNWKIHWITQSWNGFKFVCDSWSRPLPPPVKYALFANNNYYKSLPHDSRLAQNILNTFSLMRTGWFSQSTGNLLIFRFPVLRNNLIWSWGELRFSYLPSLHYTGIPKLKKVKSFLSRRTNI